ncbi:hypothetical protein BGX38DRAFT_1282024 [Terfezia claveryi]|nr:hypothetical protein BGX38DRAFT_1282024 [Terfezia claveryi]
MVQIKESSTLLLNLSVGYPCKSTRATSLVALPHPLVSKRPGQFRDIGRAYAVSCSPVDAVPLHRGLKLLKLLSHKAMNATQPSSTSAINDFAMFSQFRAESQLNSAHHPHLNSQVHPPSKRPSTPIALIIDFLLEWAMQALFGVGRDYLAYAE